MLSGGFLSPSTKTDADQVKFVNCAPSGGGVPGAVWDRLGNKAEIIGRYCCLTPANPDRTYEHQDEYHLPVKPLASHHLPE